MALDLMPPPELAGANGLPEWEGERRRRALNMWEPIHHVQNGVHSLGTIRIAYETAISPAVVHPDCEQILRFKARGPNQKVQEGRHGGGCGGDDHHSEGSGTRQKDRPNLQSPREPERFRIGPKGRKRLNP
jgi:hypothetical protein